PVQPVFEEYVREIGVADRVAFVPGDFFRDPLPRADVVVLGHVLHDWGLDEKRTLLGKAYDALPTGGAPALYEALIHAERRQRGRLRGDRRAARVFRRSVDATEKNAEGTPHGDRHPA